MATIKLSFSDMINEHAKFHFDKITIEMSHNHFAEHLRRIGICHIDTEKKLEKKAYKKEH